MGLKKKIVSIVWVKLQRESNQCGVRTNNEPPSASNSGRMQKLFLHFQKRERGLKCLT